MLPEWVYWAVIAVETTVIGFFVQYHWTQYVNMGMRITALETDKAIRDKKTE